MANKYLLELKKLILDFLSGEDSKVYLVGSRAKGTARNNSDVDIALSLPDNYPEGEVAKLRYLIEESHVPYRVDLMDLRFTNEVFKEEVMKGAVL